MTSLKVGYWVPYISPANVISSEEISNSQGGNENSPRNRDIKVRKNEMKLRKKDFEVRKNFLIPPWKILIFYRGNFDFLGGVVSGSSECIGVRRSYQTCNCWRNVQKCFVGGHPLCQRM